MLRHWQVARHFCVKVHKKCVISHKIPPPQILVKKWADECLLKLNIEKCKSDKHIRYNWSNKNCNVLFPVPPGIEKVEGSKKLFASGASKIVPITFTTVAPPTVKILVTSLCLHHLLAPIKMSNFPDPYSRCAVPYLATWLSLLFASIITIPTLWHFSSFQRVRCNAEDVFSRHTLCFNSQ